MSDDTESGSGEDRGQSNPYVTAAVVLAMLVAAAYVVSGFVTWFQGFTMLFQLPNL